MREAIVRKDRDGVERSSVAAWIPREFYDAIRDNAKENERSIASEVNLAIREYVQNHSLIETNKRV